MNPVPLTDPTGAVRAYACGRCGLIRGDSGNRTHIPTGQEAEYAEEQTRRSLRNAEWCCRCCDCDTPLTNGDTHGRCPPCAASNEARLAAHWAESARLDALREATLDHALDRDAARDLCAFMGDLSELHYYAGWLVGLDEMLWSLVRSGVDDDARGPTAEDVANLRRLSEQAGGWWRWDDDLGGEVFVPMARWLVMAGGDAGA